MKPPGMDGRGDPSAGRRFSVLVAALVLGLFVAGPVQAQDSLGSYRFEIDGQSYAVPSLRVKAGKGKPRQELISLRGTAAAIDATVKPAGAPGSFKMELAGIIIQFSSEYPSIVHVGDRIVSLSRNARRVGSDLYLPPDFLTRIVIPVLRPSALQNAIGPGGPGATADSAALPGSSSRETEFIAQASSRSYPSARNASSPPPRNASSPPPRNASPPSARAGAPPVSELLPVREDGSASTAAGSTDAAAPAAAVAVLKGRSAPPARSERVSSQPREGIVVVLDPGHGGTEMGAGGKTGAFEKEITLDVARRLKGILGSEADMSVLLTRDGDAAVALDERTALANQNHADLFVSIHVNSSPRRDARGAETYLLSYKAKDEEVRTLAAIENNAAGVDRERMGEVPEGLELVLWDMAQSQYLEESSRLAEAIQNSLNDALGVKDRGVKQAPFRVLMGATMPAVLVEIGFISNPAEEKSLKTEEYRDRIAQSLARAINAYLPEARRRFATPAQRVR